jgi:hypothetical protein
MKITFHRFNMGDVEDVDVYVAGPIHDWQQTEQGRWVMENAYNLTYHTQVDASHWGIDVAIRGEINDPKKITEYFLRWPKH